MPNVDKLLDRLVSLHTLKSIGQGVVKHPYATALGAGGIVAGVDAYDTKATELESELMKNRLGAPGGKYVTAELENVERRKAYLEDVTAFSKHAFDLGKFPESVQKGMGGAVGVLGVDLIKGLLSSVLSSISNAVTSNPTRRKILSDIIMHDPIVSVYEGQHPGAAEKAYESMVRAAPTISLDPNVVTSFLREAAQTGGMLNYMTIKQLAEAEGAIVKAHMSGGR